MGEKKVCICIIPNAFVNVEIFNAHSTCPYSQTQNFGVKCLAYFSYLFLNTELELKEMRIWECETFKKAIWRKGIEIYCTLFFTSPSKLFTNIYLLTLSKHERIPFNKRTSWYCQNLYSVIYTSKIRWMDRHSWKGGGELHEYIRESFETNLLRWCRAKKETSKFWYWEKTSETGKAMNNIHDKYMDMINFFRFSDIYKY